MTEAHDPEAFYVPSLTDVADELAAADSSHRLATDAWQAGDRDTARLYHERRERHWRRARLLLATVMATADREAPKTEKAQEAPSPPFEWHLVASGGPLDGIPIVFRTLSGWCWFGERTGGKVCAFVEAPHRPGWGHDTTVLGHYEVSPSAFTVRCDWHPEPPPITLSGLVS